MEAPLHLPSTSSRLPSPLLPPSRDVCPAFVTVESKLPLAGADRSITPVNRNFPTSIRTVFDRSSCIQRATNTSLRSTSRFSNTRTVSSLRRKIFRATKTKNARSDKNFRPIPNKQIYGDLSHFFSIRSKFAYFEFFTSDGPRDIVPPRGFLLLEFRYGPTP